MSFSIKSIFSKTILTLFTASVLLGSSLFAKEPTQQERNEMAAKLIPIIMMLLMDGDTTPPAKPSLTTPVPVVASSGTLEVEVNGEAGSKVYVDGVQVGTVGANGKTNIELTFVNGTNDMTITLKDQAGNESEGLSFSVSYDAPPVISLTGDEDIYLVKGNTFVEPGVTAIDANDGTVSVDVNGTVDTSTVGDYNLTYSATDSHGNIATKIRKVHILPAGASSTVLPMDLTKVDGFNGATEPSKLAGEIQNQYWVQAFGTLTEAELQTIVAKYPIVTVIGYSDTYGLLVEIPLDNVEAKSAIKSIELEEKVLNVRHRVYIGADTIGKNSITLPNDNVSGYYDDGDNWHLEYIDILNAWEITTGSSEVAVGVVDGGFYANHEDITIKTRNNLSKGVQDEHGTAVASIIAADTNNGKGITGINWASPLVVSIYKDFDTNITWSPEVYYRDIFEISTDHTKVKLVNCSFGPHPIEKNKAIKRSFKRLDVINKYKNKLFIFSAGNEHNNSELGIGALHLDGFGGNNKNTDNILIVAALLKDGTLPQYSNYGETVDIAAPTMVKAARGVNTYYETQAIYYGTTHSDGYVHNKPIYDNNVSSAFGGTSAAAPVVTGVASLIYSLNPDFTPQEVKKILIDSSVSKVCLRHTVFGYTDINVGLIEGIPGGHCIPILNAGNALALAKKIVEAKEANLLHYYPSVFSNLCNVYIKPPTSALQIESLDLSVRGKKRSDGTWENITVAPSNAPLTRLSDNSHELAFPTDSKYEEYNITGTLTYQGYESIEVGLIMPHDLAEIAMKVKDKVSHNNLDSVHLLLDYFGEGKIFDQNITIYTKQDKTYKIILEKDGYKKYAEKIVSHGAFELFSLKSIEMSPATSDAIGGIAGRVLSEDGTRITNARVALVSSTGTVQTSFTQKNGIYRLLDIPILDNNDAFIVYDLNITRAGYLSETVEAIGLSDGQTVSKSITLKKDPTYTNIPPVANAGSDQSITMGQSVTLSASASSDVETAHAYLSYKWSGVSIDTSYDENVTLANLPVGVHHIILQVTDEEGAVSTDSVDVTVSETGTITHNGTTYGTVTSPYTGKVWLDRNLGASQVCTSFDDTACYGDYYQWGRNYDGHQSSTSSTTSTQATDVNSAGGSFITGSSDWASVDGAGTTRTANWSATDGSSVCPVGFRVPTIAELKAELLDVNSAQIQNRYDAFNSFLKLPSAGNRYYYSDSLHDQGSWGNVWSSSVYGSHSHYVIFHSGYAGTSSYYDRAYGFTVRCLRD